VLNPTTSAICNVLPEPFHCYMLLHWSWERWIGGVTGLWAGWCGFQFWQGQGIYLFSKTSRLAQGHTQPLGGAHSQSVKQLGHEADRSSSFSVEVKNEWRCSSTLRIYFHGIDRDNFPFTCYMLLWQECLYF
jgi:hypothetical protein